MLPRSSGVLMHPTSLPEGILGPEAYAFVDWLVAAGQSWWQMLPIGPPDDFGSPYRAASAFAGWVGLLGDQGSKLGQDEMRRFRAANEYWIDEWSEHAGSGALADQARFDRAWQELRAYAARRGVRLIGDIPIYVAWGSIDHLCRPEFFLPDLVAGVPPDDFSATGQLWGNPLYNWPTLRRTGYRWWVERLRRMLALFDLVRVDHFRGFVAYWAIPLESDTAVDGHWRRGPGGAVFEAAERELGALPLFVEDLGVITPAVERLRDQLELPGMAVLQYAFVDDEQSPHRLDKHRERMVVCTATHDHVPVHAWWHEVATEAERERAEREAEVRGIYDAEPHWRLIRLALSSRARLAVVPIQDVLGLGASARMNTPATVAGNWSWRLESGVLTRELAERMRSATEQAHRVPTASR